jgi:hypothetical protein
VEVYRTPHTELLGGVCHRVARVAARCCYEMGLGTVLQNAVVG